MAKLDTSDETSPISLAEQLRAIDALDLKNVEPEYRGIIALLQGINPDLEQARKAFRSLQCSRADKVGDVVRENTKATPALRAYLAFHGYKSEDDKPYIREME